MTIGNARGGVLGDALASVLDRAGYNVWREFYVNDAGNQVDLFGRSIEVRYLQLILGEGAVEFLKMATTVTISVGSLSLYTKMKVINTLTCLRRSVAPPSLLSVCLTTFHL